MDSLREVPAPSQEESAGDDQALYQDSTLSVSESSLLVMAFAVCHKLSGVGTYSAPLSKTKQMHY